VEEQLAAIYVERMIKLFCVKHALNSKGKKVLKKLTSSVLVKGLIKFWY
jgi:hypothetical protein